jgi:mevalonate kinase
MRTLSDIIVQYVSFVGKDKARFIENLTDEELELFINHCQNLLDTVGIMREALSKLQSEYNRRKPIRREKKLNDLGL